MKIKNLFSVIFVCILYTLSIGASLENYIGISIIINLIASILIIAYYKYVNYGFTNLTNIFHGFSILYGLSGPIVVYWGEGLSPIFGYNYNIAIFLIAYALSNIGFLFGVVLYNFMLPNIKNTIYLEQKKLKYFAQNKNVFLVSAIFFSFISMIFELVNFYRVGGFQTVLSGKATYQSKVSELTMSLPSGNATEIGAVLISIYLAICLYNKIKIDKDKILVYILFASPYFLLTLFLGKRGSLLSILMILIVGIHFFKPVKRIKPKLLITLIVFYISMGFLYANRGIASLIITDTEQFTEIAFNKERLVKALNPGAQEFGAPLGNFNKFYVVNNGDFELLLGESYLKGLVLPIPSFVYPGEKPQQIGYEFRDKYFPAEAARGSIAGTAFSSILEAFWNFSYIGIFSIYMIYGFLLQYFDKILKYLNIYSAIIYILLVPRVLTIHRTSMGNIFAMMFINTVLIAFVIPLIKNFIFKKKLSVKRGNI